MKVLIIHYMPRSVIQFHLDNHRRGQEMNLWAFVPFWNQVASNNTNSGLEVHFLFGDALAPLVEEATQVGPMKAVSSENIHYIGDEDVVYLRSRNQQKSRINIILARVFPCGFWPDAVVHRMPEPWVQAMLPSTHAFYMEVGPLNRMPYPPTVFFDPLAYGADSVVGKFSKSILDSGHRLEGVISDIRAALKPAFYQFDGPWEQFIRSVRMQFGGGVLLFAAQYQNFFYSPYTRFERIGDLLEDVLRHTPPHVAIVFCPRVHNRPDHGISEHRVQKLQSAYSNLVLVPGHLYEAYYTQMLVPYADGVIAVTSTVGQQAVFWGKHWFTSPECYYRHYTPTYEHIGQSIDNPPSMKAKAFLNWVFHRYAFPSSLMCRRGALEAYLSKVVDQVDQLNSPSSAFFSDEGIFSAQELLRYYKV